MMKGSIKHTVKNQKLRKLKSLRQPASGDFWVFSTFCCINWKQHHLKLVDFLSFLSFWFFTVHRHMKSDITTQLNILVQVLSGLCLFIQRLVKGAGDVGRNWTRVGHMSTTALYEENWMITIQSQKWMALVFSRSFLGALACDGLQLLSVRLRLLLLLQELLSVFLRLAVRLLQLLQKRHFLLLHTQCHVCYTLIAALID